MNNVYNICLKMLALSGYRLQYVLQRWAMTLAPGDAQPRWLLISIVSSLSASVIGIVSGAFGLWLLQKRRKRRRYLSTVTHDSEDDLMVQPVNRDRL